MLVKKVHEMLEIFQKLNVISVKLVVYSLNMLRGGGILHIIPLTFDNFNNMFDILKILLEMLKYLIHFYRVTHLIISRWTKPVGSVK